MGEVPIVVIFLAEESCSQAYFSLTKHAEVPRLLTIANHPEVFLKEDSGVRFSIYGRYLNVCCHLLLNGEPQALVRNA